MAGVPLPMHRFHPINRDTELLLPLSVQELSMGHQTRYAVDMVESSDLGRMALT